ncbi:MAG: 30S ribosomal protein S15 [Halobacteria archaeon]
MARMHTRRRGKSSSRRFPRTALPEWAVLDASEIGNTVLALRNQGLTPSRIGMALRDRYGVPSARLAGKRVTRLLEEKGAAQKIPEDLAALLGRAVRLSKHLGAHKTDVHNRRNLQRVESKIRRLARYYSRTGKLPTDWNYSLETAEVLLAR